MLNSSRLITKTVVNLTAALAVSLIAVGTASSVFAQNSHQYAAPSASRHVAHSRDGSASNRGREAFGMATEYGFIDPNSPAATGGGSLGYNRNLLQY